MDSPMSSAISVSSVPSVVSDVNHPHNLAENQNNIDKFSHPECQEEPGTALAPQSRPIIPKYDGIPFFESGDGDFMLWVNDTCFETHKYLLKRFSILKDMLRDHSTVTLQRDEYGVEDVQNTLIVLYATILEGPYEFGKEALVSALRIATAYNYPALRTYAINHLTKAQLTAIERIKIAREFKLVSWEEPAYVELCERDEPITMEEASILGIATFVQVAGIREREQRRRGKEENSQKQGQETALNESERKHQEKRADGCEEEKNGEDSDAGLSSSPQKDAQAPGVEMKPSFIAVQTSGEYTAETWTNTAGGCQLKVSECSCRFQRSNGFTYHAPCTLPACAVAAFKNLQIQQIVHGNNISNLQSFVEKLNPSMITRTPTLIKPAPKPALTSPKALHSPIHNEVRLMLGVLGNTQDVV